MTVRRSCVQDHRRRREPAPSRDRACRGMRARRALVALVGRCEDGTRSKHTTHGALCPGAAAHLIGGGGGVHPPGIEMANIGTGLTRDEAAEVFIPSRKTCPATPLAVATRQPRHLHPSRPRRFVAASRTNVATGLGYPGWDCPYSVGTQATSLPPFRLHWLAVRWRPTPTSRDGGAALPAHRLAS